MFRRLWIAVLACALISFLGVSAILATSWIENRHVPALGWVLLASNALMFLMATSYVRFRWTDARAAAGGISVEQLGELANVSGAGAAASPNDLRVSA